MNGVIYDAGATYPYHMNGVLYHAGTTYPYHMNGVLYDAGTTYPYHMNGVLYHAGTRKNLKLTNLDCLPQSFVVIIVILKLTLFIVDHQIAFVIYGKVRVGNTRLTHITDSGKLVPRCLSASVISTLQTVHIWSVCF